MNYQEYESHNVDVTVYKGLCEKIDGHSHPSFLFLYLNHQTLFFWLCIEILNEKGGVHYHYHYYDVKSRDAENFLRDGQLSVATGLEKKSGIKDHKHRIHFKSADKQGLILDPFNIMQNEI